MKFFVTGPSFTHLFGTIQNFENKRPSMKVELSPQKLQYSFTHSAPRFWNDLPLELRNSDFLVEFPNGLKTYLCVFALAYPP